MLYRSQDEQLSRGDVMPTYDNNSFDFDEWVQLAAKDTDDFESKRSEYISQYIEQVPKKYLERIIGLQWKLDMERQLFSSPLASCQHMYQQMWDSLYSEEGLYDQINSLLLYMSSPEVYYEKISKKETRPVKDNIIYLV